MSGGSISNGQKGPSGKGTEPTDIGGYRDQKALEHGQKTIKYLEKQVQRQKDANNLLSDRLRKLAQEGQIKIQALRDMYAAQTDELVSARLMADKYLAKCDELKEKIDELETTLDEEFLG